MRQFTQQVLYRFATW